MKTHHKWALELDKQLKALGLPDGSWSLTSFNVATNAKVIKITYPGDWDDAKKAQAQALIDAWPSQTVIDSVATNQKKLDLRDKVIAAMVDSLVAGKVPNDPVMADIANKLSADIGAVNAVTPIGP